jgi:hypothetical protein
MTEDLVVLRSYLILEVGWLTTCRIKTKGKKKKDTGSAPNTNASPSGPAPMQIALTPFPKGVDVKRFLQDCR